MRYLSVRDPYKAGGEVLYVAGNGGDMRHTKRISGVAGMAAAVALALTACTTSVTTVIRPATSSTASPGATTGAPASPSLSPSPKASPSPTGPVVTITPDSGGTGADPSAGITVTTASGTLKNVTVTNAGDPVVGAYAAGRTSWHNIYALDVSTSYTVTASATSAAGTTTKSVKFRTLTPKSTVTAEIFEGYQASYGVGMPIILTFSQPITDKAAVEQSIQLKTSKLVIGAWYWDGNETLDFRPRDYWPANTTVTLAAHLNGVDGGGGRYGTHTLTQTFGIGQSLIAVANTVTHKTQIYVGGQLTYTWPISTGKTTTPTPNGTYLTVQKGNPVRMIGGTKGQPGYYNELVNWAVRFTYSGDYYHSAPWSVVNQGVSNVSHGCVNLAPADAETYYNLAIPGDPITITGSAKAGDWDNGWTEWSLSWQQYLQGSATGMAVEAGPQGSTFVSPSALSADAGTVPLGTSAPGNYLVG